MNTSRVEGMDRRWERARCLDLRTAPEPPQWIGRRSVGIFGRHWLIYQPFFSPLISIYHRSLYIYISMLRSTPHSINRGSPNHISQTIACPYSTISSLMTLDSMEGGYCINLTFSLPQSHHLLPNLRPNSDQIRGPNPSPITTTQP